MSGAACQVAYRAAMQRIKDLQASSSPIKSLKDSKLKPMHFSGFNADKLKQAEDSLRTVMYLSCWGPN